jgi:glycosyltransferase involved in cell wall biosynthesis
MSLSSSALVSVVVPAYNHEQYVELALRSVLEQDYGPIELIVLDDCSKDGTADVVREFVNRADVTARFERVVFAANEQNLGANRTINRGLGECRGNYINILNSDDLFAPTRLARLVKVCQESMADCAFSRVVLLADEPAVSSNEIDYFYGVQDSINLFPTVGYAFLRNQCALSTGNIFFSRVVRDRVGGFNDLKYCHDWDFILRTLLVTEPVFVPEPLYFYRLHSGNSFLQLQSVAEAETDWVLRNYFFLCRNRPVTNPVAPSPAWGPFFQNFIKQANYAKYLAKP